MSYTPSELIAALDRHGIEVTERRLTDWREKGLLPPLKRIGLGRGKGTQQVWESDEVLQQAIAAEYFLSVKSRTRYALSRLWLAGFDVPVELGTKAWLGEIGNRKKVIERLSGRRAGGLDALLNSWITTVAKQVFRNNTGKQDLVTELIMNWLEMIYDPKLEIDYWERAELINEQYNLSLNQHTHGELRSVLEHVATAISAFSVYNLPEILKDFKIGEFGKANIAMRLFKNAILRGMTISMSEIDLSHHVGTTARIVSGIAPALIISHVIFQRGKAESQLDNSIEIIANSLNLLSNSDMIRSHNSRISLSDDGKSVLEQAKTELKELWSDFGRDADQWNTDSAKPSSPN